MAFRTITIAGTFIFASVVLAFSALYGSFRREYVSPARLMTAATPADIYSAWQMNKVKGRIAIMFTRRLNTEEQGELAKENITERALQYGIVRKVYHVVPDSAWSSVYEALSQRRATRPTYSGFTLLFPSGSVTVTQLSNFSPVKEKVLVVVEPAIWTAHELEKIAFMIKDARIATDIVTIVRGRDYDHMIFEQAIASQ